MTNTSTAEKVLARIVTGSKVLHKSIISQSINQSLLRQKAALYKNCIKLYTPCPEKEPTVFYA